MLPKLNYSIELNFASNRFNLSCATGWLAADYYIEWYPKKFNCRHNKWNWIKNWQTSVKVLACGPCGFKLVQVEPKSQLKYLLLAKIIQLKNEWVVWSGLMEFNLFWLCDIYSCSKPVSVRRHCFLRLVSYWRHLDVTYRCANKINSDQWLLNQCKYWWLANSSTSSFRLPMNSKSMATTREHSPYDKLI